MTETLTQDRVEAGRRLAALYEAGFTLPELARIYGRSVTFIRTLILESGGVMRPKGVIPKPKPPRGSRQKLTPEQAEEIRQRRAAGETLDAIATDYPVTREWVRQLTRDIKVKTRLDSDDHDAIALRYADGEEADDLAAEFGVGRDRVHEFVRSRGFTVRQNRDYSTRRCLTPEQVIEIRRRNVAGEAEGALAAEFGVAQATISSVVLGQRYAELPGARDRVVVRRARRAQRFFDADTIRAIRARYAAGGVSQAALAAEYDTAQTQISAIVRRENYREVS